MRATLFGLVALLVSGIAIPVLAAPSGRMTAMKSKMAEMQARDPQGFASCQALAASGGYRIAKPNDYEYVVVVSFIDGCLMGKQR